MGLFSLVLRRPAQSAGNDVVETVVGPSATFTGTIRCDGGVAIKGRFEGIVEVGGNVVIGRDAIVAANIAGKDVVVGGMVKGNIESSGRIEILSTGQVFGDLTASAIMIDEGGMFQGISRMRGAVNPSRTLAAPRDAAPPPRENVIIDLTGGRTNGAPNAKPAKAATQAQETVVAGAAGHAPIGPMDLNIEPVIPGAATSGRQDAGARAQRNRTSNRR